MQEGDALVGVVGPEERRADALRHHQPDGAAEQRAKQTGEREIAQQPFEEHGNAGQTQAEQRR